MESKSTKGAPNSTNNSYEIIERSPTVSEHQALWDSVSWGNLDTGMSEQSIANSIYAVVVEIEGQAVGMGRIVGDGAMYFYLQDVAVHPDHQGHGLGKRIVERLLAYIRQHKHEKGIAFVGLFASQGKEPFYEQFGFKDHSPGMTGMFTVFEPTAPQE
ncbi:GNAT family N-acetyltransferase [Paenibacillus rhizovicinus]|uniref:GNAT family N-acetyltransferase n=1 Tax=Paenibacillus rhizovicinus TaxID=2704463 RepID=A0A6C0NZZ7_9BACL|nr:GNAT family N-acetyltransferase [Paenibacillus rhizovicinus]QHW31779.1 GNAT family N-acetyltransferase [Paenibacillus rhizovicinus]